MTGVLPGHRRRGIALAMKLRAIEFVRSSGMRWLVALHHPRNASVIGMNRRLGGRAPLMSLFSRPFWHESGTARRPVADRSEDQVELDVNDLHYLLL